MKVVEYWHGTIKKYRYDGEVSGSRGAEISMQGTPHEAHMT